MTPDMVSPGHKEFKYRWSKSLRDSLNLLQTLDKERLYINNNSPEQTSNHNHYIN